MNKTIQEWLSSIEFMKFMEITERVIEELLVSDHESDLESHLLEMGGRYNHFVFQVSESMIEDLKNKQASDEEISKEILRFIKKIENEALIRYPEIMQVFFNYRDSTKRK